MFIQVFKRYLYDILMFIQCLNVLDNTKNRHHCHLSIICSNLLFVICVSLQINNNNSLHPPIFTIFGIAMAPSLILKNWFWSYLQLELFIVRFCTYEHLFFVFFCCCCYFCFVVVAFFCRVKFARKMCSHVKDFN